MPYKNVQERRKKQAAWLAAKRARGRQVGIDSSDFEDRQKDRQENSSHLVAGARAIVGAEAITATASKAVAAGSVESEARARVECEWREAERRAEWAMKEGRARGPERASLSALLVEVGSEARARSEVGELAPAIPPVPKQPATLEERVLTSTHRFEIVARTVRKRAPRTIPGVKLERKGFGKRMEFGVVQLDSARVEFYSGAVKLVVERNITDLSEAQIEGFKAVLRRQAEFKGIELLPEEAPEKARAKLAADPYARLNWSVGGWCHTVCEDEELNEMVCEAARAGAPFQGDVYLNGQKPDGSHPENAELYGRLCARAPINIKELFLLLPERMDSFEANQAEMVEALGRASEGQARLADAFEKLMAMVAGAPGPVAGPAPKDAYR